ncbi:MAG TPA: hypothetical protein VGN00_21425 [Puia sp.]|jgi:hypothetical protein
MIKFLVSILLIALLSFVCGLFLPWWTIGVAAFVVSALIPLKPLHAFFAGFLAIFLLWGGLAFGIDQQNNSILSAKIAAILPLGGSVIALILVTAFVGALVGGGAAITGAFLKAAR